MHIFQGWLGSEPGEIAADRERTPSCRSSAHQFYLQPRLLIHTTLSFLFFLLTSCNSILISLFHISPHFFSYHLNSFNFTSSHLTSPSISNQRMYSVMIWVSLHITYTTRGKVGGVSADRRELPLAVFSPGSPSNQPTWRICFRDASGEGKAGGRRCASLSFCLLNYLFLNEWDKNIIGIYT